MKKRTFLFALIMLFAVLHSACGQASAPGDSNTLSQAPASTAASAAPEQATPAATPEPTAAPTPASAQAIIATIDQFPLVTAQQEPQQVKQAQEIFSAMVESYNAVMDMYVVGLGAYAEDDGPYPEDGYQEAAHPVYKTLQDVEALRDSACTRDFSESYFGKWASPKFIEKEGKLYEFMADMGGSIGLSIYFRPDVFFAIEQEEENEEIIFTCYAGDNDGTWTETPAPLFATVRLLNAAQGWRVDGCKLFYFEEGMEKVLDSGNWEESSRQ